MYTMLHRYVLDQVVKPQFNAGEDLTIHYHKTREEALADAKDNKGIDELAAEVVSYLESCGSLSPG